MQFFSVTRTVGAVIVWASICLTPAAAGEIYRWTDENGNVHYTDKPIGESSEIVDIQSRATSPETVQRENRNWQQELERRQAQQAEKPAKPSREQVAAKREADQESCEIYRERLNTFHWSHRLFREDENGERTYLTSEEIDDARTKLQEKVDRFCKS